MPSAARQRLPVDLGFHGHGKRCNGGPGYAYFIQEIQANPGHCDVSEDDKQHRQGIRKHCNKTQRKQADTTAQRSPKLIPRRNSAEFQQTTNDDRKDTFELSSSAKSSSCPSLSTFISDAYAMDSSIVPHPSEVPFPPLEWLQLSKQSVSAVVSSITLKAVLCCHVPTT